MAGFTLITALVSLSVTSVLAAPQGTGGGGEGGAGGFVPLINKQYTWDNIVRSRLVLHPRPSLADFYTGSPTKSIPTED
jgi:hypothetical protein